MQHMKSSEILREKPDYNYVKTLRAVLSKYLMQYPAELQLYGYLPAISQIF